MRRSLTALVLAGTLATPLWPRQLGARLLARLGLGTGGAGARIDDRGARASGLRLLSGLFLRLWLSGLWL